MTVAIRFAHKGIAGGRDYQEDYCQFAEIADEGGTASGGDHEILAVLADGMGGQGAAGSGATASETACHSFVSRYAEASGSIADRLGGALSASNESIARKKEDEPQLGDMGTTLIGASFHQGHLQWVSVGDSLLYLYRDGAVQRLNEDHSLAPMLDQLADQGEMTREEALNHRSRNAVRSAVMGHEIELTDLQQEAYPLRDGDVVLLASDGLDTLDEDQIAALIDSRAGGGPEAIADALLQAVEDAGKPDQDNTMVMAITAHDAEVEATPRGVPVLGIVIAAALLAAAGGAVYWFASGVQEQTTEKPAPAQQTKNKMPKDESKTAKPQPADSNKAERPTDTPPSGERSKSDKAPAPQPQKTERQSPPQPEPAAKDREAAPALPAVPAVPKTPQAQPAVAPPAQPSREVGAPAQQPQRKAQPNVPSQPPRPETPAPAAPAAPGEPPPAGSVQSQ